MYVFSHSEDLLSENNRIGVGRHVSVCTSSLLLKAAVIVLPTSHYGRPSKMRFHWRTDGVLPRPIWRSAQGLGPDICGGGSLTSFPLLKYLNSRPRNASSTNTIRACKSLLLLIRISKSRGVVWNLASRRQNGVVEMPSSVGHLSSPRFNVCCT